MKRSLRFSWVSLLTSVFLPLALLADDSIQEDIVPTALHPYLARSHFLKRTDDEVGRIATEFCIENGFARAASFRIEKQKYPNDTLFFTDPLALRTLTAYPLPHVVRRNKHYVGRDSYWFQHPDDHLQIEAESFSELNCVGDTKKVEAYRISFALHQLANQENQDDQESMIPLLENFVGRNQQSLATPTEIPNPPDQKSRLNRLVLEFGKTYLHKKEEMKKNHGFTAPTL